MRKQQLMELKVGDKVISKKDNSISTVTAIGAKVTLSNDKQYSQSTMIRWYSLHDDDNTDTEEFDVESFNSEQQQEQDTTADTEEQTNTSDLQDTDTAVKKDVISRDTATTSDKITKDDIIYIIEHSNCDAVVKKQYIGAYKEDYKGAVVMVRTTKKGNTHIDMKQGIFNSLAESTRNRLEANYNAKVYDSTRGYIRLFEVDDLAVLQDLILAALKIA